MTTPPKPPQPRDNEHSTGVACPHCAAHPAKPVSVSTRKGDSGSVDVKMLCATCQHTWIVPKLTHDDPPA